MSLNQKNENMGGIFEPEFLFYDHIISCNIVEQMHSMYLYYSQKWSSFPECKMEISVQPNADGLYDVNCTIRIPQPYITPEFQLLMKQMKIRPIIIRFKTADSELHVIGSKLNPLSLIAEKTTPKVQEFNGAILSFSGTQPHEQLLYKEF